MALIINPSDHDTRNKTVLEIADDLYEETGDKRFYLQRMCKAGACMTCRCKLKGGMIDGVDFRNMDRFSGEFLACQTYIEKYSDLFVCEQIGPS